MALPAVALLRHLPNAFGHNAGCLQADRHGFGGGWLRRRGRHVFRREGKGRGLRMGGGGHRRGRTGRLRQHGPGQQVPEDESHACRHRDAAYGKSARPQAGRPAPGQNPRGQTLSGGFGGRLGRCARQGRLPSCGLVRRHRTCAGRMPVWMAQKAISLIDPRRIDFVPFVARVTVRMI